MSIMVEAKQKRLIRGYWPEKEFAAHRDQLEMESLVGSRGLRIVGKGETGVCAEFRFD